MIVFIFSQFFLLAAEIEQVGHMEPFYSSAVAAA